MDEDFPHVRQFTEAAEDYLYAATATGDYKLREAAWERLFSAGRTLLGCGEVGVDALVALVDDSSPVVSLFACLFVADCVPARCRPRLETLCVDDSFVGLAAEMAIWRLDAGEAVLCMEPPTPGPRAVHVRPSLPEQIEALDELLADPPDEVNYKDMAEPESAVERLARASGLANAVGCCEDYAEFCPDEVPPSLFAKCIWAWVIRPDLSEAIALRGGPLLAAAIADYEGMGC